MVLPEVVKDAILEEITLDTLGLTKDAYGIRGSNEVDIEEVQENIRKIIDAEVYKNAKEFNRASLDEQHTRRLMAAIQAYWGVAHKTLIDNSLGRIKRKLVQPVCKWVDTMIHDPSIVQYAKEDSRTTRRREECQKQLTTLEESKRLLRDTC